MGNTGSVIVKIKMMPTSPETDLAKIEADAKSLLEKNEARNIGFEQEPIAFGLKAVYASFIWPEDKSLENLEQEFRKIDSVQSAEIADMRRAIG